MRSAAGRRRRQAGRSAALRWQQCGARAHCNRQPGEIGVPTENYAGKNRRAKLMRSALRRTRIIVIIQARTGARYHPCKQKRQRNTREYRKRKYKLEARYGAKITRGPDDRYKGTVRRKGSRGLRV